MRILSYVALGAVIAGFVVIGAAAVWVAQLEVPSLDGFDARKVTQSTKIYDRTGDILLFDLHEDIRRTVVPLEDISRHIKNATIAIEDANFYDHKGIQPVAIMRAVWVNILARGYAQGGSTITQQVIKNTLLTTEKTISRKIKEWILALKIEQQLEKDEILSIYLNETPYGGNLYGVEESSRYYFAKNADEVTLAEAAYLAALPQAPTYYSPYGQNKTALDNRKNLVLARMFERGFITEETYTEALNEEVEFIEHSDTSIEAPHFVFYIRQILEEEYGTDVVYESGLRVITTLDYDLQKAAESTVADFAFENEDKFNAENAALVALDPQNGQILAMVGSRDYFDEDIDGKFNVTTAQRQPGSTFKPFVYAAAFEKGFTPETVVFDVQTQFSAACRPDEIDGENPNCYVPGNYDGVFRGPMTLRDALAQSINVPAVKVLHLAGIDTALALVRKLGITSLTQDAFFYGFSLVLGGGEVSPLELASAYGVFANEGTRHPHTGILKVEDAGGTTLAEFTENAEQVIDQETARHVADVLSDNAARAPSYGQRSAFWFGDGVDVASKTGTTNDFRDVWIVGFTPNLVVVTWAGNNDNSPIVKRVAGFVLAPMWRAFMDKALPTRTQENFVDPPSYPEDLKPQLLGEWNIGGQVHSVLHWINKNNPLGPPPVNPSSDSQYALWEYPISNWLASNGISASSTDGGSSGTNGGSQDSSSLSDGLSEVIRIVNPRSGSVVQAGQPLTLSISQPQNFTPTRVEYYVNNSFIGGSTQAPYSLSFVPQYSGEQDSTIRAVITDSTLGITTNAEVRFRVQ